MSAATVVESLEKADHSVVLVGIATDGSWHLADRALPLEASGPEVELMVPSGRLRGPHGETAFEVVFPVLHGPHGEDGTVQGMLEMVEAPYVGAGVLASAAAMDKDVANRLFLQAGLPIVDSVAVTVDAYAEQMDGALIDRFGLPLFVKPAALGSSVGITRVVEPFELPGAMALGFKYGDKVVVEEAVVGREIEVAVLEGPRTSLPGEIVAPDWYDYEAKYHDDATELRVPAPLSDAASAEVRKLAATAFHALGVRGLARVDFFYDEEGRGFLVNELNTMPGCTSRSMFPMLWEATGVSNVELFDELVRLAMSGRRAP